MTTNSENLVYFGEGTHKQINRFLDLLDRFLDLQQQLVWVLAVIAGVILLRLFGDLIRGLRKRPGKGEKGGL
jgi:hypothetical protein